MKSKHTPKQKAGIRPRDPNNASAAASAVTEGRRTRVVAVGNQKGGVGKTTVTVNLAAALAEAGAKVLVWDLDMNCGATQTLGIELGAFAGTLEVLLGDEPINDVILRGGDAEAQEAGVDLPERLDLIPAARDLESINERLAERRKFLDYRGLIRKPLQHVEGQYDFVLLDTAPNATAPTLAAYAAADYFVLATVPEPLAVNALQQAIADIAEAQDSVNPDLQLLGVVVGSLDERGKITRQINEFVADAFAHTEAGGPGGTSGTAKFETTISRSVVVPQAQAAKRPVIQHDPQHKVAGQFRELAAEVLMRVAAAEGVELDEVTDSPAGEGAAAQLAA